MGEPKNSFFYKTGVDHHFFRHSTCISAFLGRHTGIPQFAQTQVLPSLDPRNMFWLSCAGTSSAPPALPRDVVRTDFGYKELKHWKKCKEMGVSENSVPLNPMVNDHYPY